MSKTAENMRAMARSGDEEGVKAMLLVLQRRAETAPSAPGKRSKLERVLAGRDPVSGNTALHYCCANGHSNIALTLVDAGAPVDALNNSGSTPLHYAALTGQLDVVNGLVDSGADLLLRNNFGNTPHDEAVQCNHRPVADLLMRTVEQRSADSSTALDKVATDEPEPDAS